MKIFLGIFYNYRKSKETDELSMFVEEQTCKGCSCSCTIQDLHLHLGSGEFTRCKKKYSQLELDQILKAFIRFRKIKKFGRLVVYYYLSLQENKLSLILFTIPGNLRSW